MADRQVEDEEKKIKFQISQEDLLCRNGCGFYGTPQWDNRCSKCWRAYQVVLKRNQDFAKNKTLLSFDQFQERRKTTHQSRSLTFKKLFNTDTPNSPTSPSGTPTRRRELSPDSLEAREALSTYLVTQLPSSVVQEVTRQVKHAVNKVYELRVSVDDMSELLQAFYQFLNEKLQATSFFHEPGCAVTIEEVMDEVEKYICICCYSVLFCSSSDEEVADVSLQDRIRSLRWVTAGFLETKLDFTNQSIRDKLDEAISHMIDVNAKRSTSEKLKCLVDCSHLIFAALNESDSGTSADEFLPVLIFVLLRGNPPLIQSNLKFLSRFALPNRVMTGETGYFFTNFSCALVYVQNMNHESLKMDKTEFEAYTSGQLAAPITAVNCIFAQLLSSLKNVSIQSEKIAKAQDKALEDIAAIQKECEEDQLELLDRLKKSTSIYPSEEYNLTISSIFDMEKLTNDSLTFFSRQSSDSGCSTLLPSSPVDQSTPFFSD